MWKPIAHQAFPTSRQLPDLTNAFVAKWLQIYSDLWKKSP